MKTKRSHGLRIFQDFLRIELLVFTFVALTNFLVFKKMRYQFHIQYAAKVGQPFENIMTCSFEAENDDIANEIAEAVFSVREHFKIRPNSIYSKTDPSLVK